MKINDDGTLYGSISPTYPPQTVLLECDNEYINLLIHSGDSIHLEFDASNMKKTVKFSGNAVENNEYLLMFESIPVIKRDPYTLNNEKIKSLPPEKYTKYCDSLYHKSVIARDEFFKKFHLSKTMKKWMYNEVEYAFLYNKSMYPELHRQLNNIRGYWNWDVPDEYFDYLKSIDISEADLINPRVIDQIVSDISFNYVHRQLMKEPPFKTINGQYTISKTIDKDSLWINGYIKLLNNGLLLQLCLCRHLGMIVRDGEFNRFEKYQYIVDKFITNQRLKEQLIKFYKESKQRFENPELNMQAILKEINNTPAKSAFDSILQLNKGKVIYVDCWATWCSPCLGETPYSKELISKLKNSPVSFVSLCFDSEKEKWSSYIKEMRWGGYHYFISKENGEYFKKLFNLNYS